MKTLLRRLDAVVLTATTGLWVVLFISVVLQVFVRYVLKLPLPWTEEVAREAFIWCSLLTAGVIVGRDQHFAITVGVDQLPERTRVQIRLVGAVLCLLLTLVLLEKGVSWSWRMRFATSEVLELPQGAVYAIIPLTAFYMSLHLIARISELVRMLRRPGVG